MKFKLEEWLKNYKPRVVGTNMTTKRNNVDALRVNIGKARGVATGFKKGNRSLGHCLPITDPDTGETYPTRKAFCDANGITISAFDYSMRICNGDLTAAIRRMKTPPGQRQRQRQASHGVPPVVNPATGRNCSTWVEIAEVYGIPVTTIYRRRARGRPLSEVLTVGRVKNNIMDHRPVHVADHVKEDKK